MKSKKIQKSKDAKIETIMVHLRFSYQKLERFKFFIKNCNFEKKCNLDQK